MARTLRPSGRGFGRWSRRPSWLYRATRIIAGAVAVVSGVAHAGISGAVSLAEPPPNVIVILADDLGVGDLGCTGSQRIRTPRIDALRASGVRCDAAYASAVVCAPSRCGLLTGRDGGHAQVRANTQLPDIDDRSGGQMGLAAGTPTFARDLQSLGYATACFGKWALGGPHPDGLSGHPLDQGFDRFLGHLCQRHATEHRTHELWSDRSIVEVPGNPPDGSGPVYVPDLITDEAVAWIESNADHPFLLFFASPLPHLPLDAPADLVESYAAEGWPDPPYEGGAGYVPCDAPRATYAAMVTRLDEHVGRLLDALADAGVADRTVVIVTSDHGPPPSMGGFDAAFFASTQGLRGFKGSVYEGGIRVPLIIAGPGIGPEGGVVDEPVGLVDLRPTLAELAGGPLTADAGIDGVSLLPLLRGEASTLDRDHLYWESPVAGGLQAVRWGRWKGVRRNALTRPDGPIELHDLEADPGETTDLAAERPEIAREVCARMATSRVPPIVEAWRFCP